MSSAEEPSVKIEFKRKSRKPIRKRCDSSEESDNNDSQESGIRSKLEDLKTIQKLRERPHGVNIVGLAIGETVSETEASTSDPFNAKSGGMVNMTALKNSKMKQEDAYDIGTQFNAETNKRDEDEEMVKYIEEELVRRKNKNKNETDDEANSSKNVYYSPEEAALQAVQEHFRENSSHQSEEMMSNQMLSGIPEVDLGIQAKIRNIEATEEAKLKLVYESQRKKDGPSQFIPTNMAVNFVQHNRFNIEDPQKKKQNPVFNRPAPNLSTNAKDKRKDTDGGATDDYHFERFKKHFRRF